MNKEDVRQKMLDIVGDIFHANEVTFSKPLTFDGHTWEEAKDTINKSFDRLAVDHPKVKLPREVGEELEDWLKTDNIDTIITDLVCYEGDHMAVRDWWDLTPDATYLIADMDRYGWEAEPEAKWYVQTPKEWWEDSAIPEWMHFDTCRGVCSGFSKLGRTSFTRAELKQYHLDSDIFTLVPVEDSHED